MEDRYEIRGELGEGGVGIVYEAWDRQLARVVAIKRLLPSDGKNAGRNSPAAVHDLLREASILSSLQHPNIVSVFDAGVDENGAYVVMERIEGEMLRDAVLRGPLLAEDFSEIVEQSLDALIAAHHQGLFHRDLKPRNLMLRWLPSDEFQMKILDFGLAKFAERPSIQTEAFKDTIMGSSAFMAPEQFLHQPLDARSDLYSLGCVFYFCLTAEEPFGADTPAGIVSAHLEHKVSPLQEKRPDLDTALCRWVMSLIEREPDKRPASAKEALRGFREANRERTETRVEPSGHTRTEMLVIPGRSKSHRVKLAVGAIGLAALVVVAGLASRSAKPKSNEDPFAKSEDPLLLQNETNRMAANENRRVKVRGRVVKTGHDAEGRHYLNFANPLFYVVCFTPANFPGGPPSDLYRDKIIEITGELGRYKERYQIKLSSPEQVRLID